MKLITKEEEEAHYSATLEGGCLGGLAGLGLGALGIAGASRRYSHIRHLTLPLKAFLVTSSGTFAAIIFADRASRSFESSRHESPYEQYADQTKRGRKQLQAQKPFAERSREWARDNRYAIIGGSWAASMGIAMGIVSRNRYQTTAQKLVQARVYAQGLTVLVLLACAALEIGDRHRETGRWETIKVIDPTDPEHKRKIEKKVYNEHAGGDTSWQNVVATEEKRMADSHEPTHQTLNAHARGRTHSKTLSRKEKKGGKSPHEGSNDHEHEMHTDIKKSAEGKS